MIHLLLIHLTPEGEWRTWRAARRAWGEQVSMQSAPDIETALAILRHVAPYEQAPRPSLVLLETGVNGVWAPETVQRLRNALSPYSVPLVGLADTSRALERLRGQRAPLDAVILNPVQPNVLQELAQSLKVKNILPTSASRLDRIRRLLFASTSSFSSRATQIAAGAVGSKSRQARPAWQWLAISLVLILVAFGGTAKASAASLPGDTLYPLKLVVQQFELALTPNQEARQKLAEELKAQHLRDIQTAQQTRRHAAIEFQGQLQQIDENTWSVGGLLVKLRPETTVTGLPPELGAWAIVKGYLPGDGSLIVTGLTVTGKGPVPIPATHQPRQKDKTPQVTPAPTEMPENEETDETGSTRQPNSTREPKATREPNPTHESKPTHDPGPKPEPKGQQDERPGQGSNRTHP